MHFYKNKTRLRRIPEVFLKAFLVFSARFILKHGADTYLGLTDNVQKGVVLNFLEKEGHCIGRFGKTELYRKHIISAFTTLIASCDDFRKTGAMVTICQGLIECICPTGKFDKDTVDKEDFSADLPAEYQDDTANFERTSFQQLYSIVDATEIILKNSNLPTIENYSLHVLQCIEAVVKNENSNFLENVGSKLTKETKEYFGEMLAHYGISLG